MSKHSSGIASQSSFARVSSPAPQRSVIPISTTRKHTGDAGYLIPALHVFCLPGDVFNFQLAIFSRLLTLKFPLMDNLILEWFAFFEPERLTWDNFERFQGFQPDPNSSTDFLLPYLTGTDVPYQIAQGTLGDYFGLPLDRDIDPTAFRIRSGPFRAYRDIYNNWFRDQNYQDTLPLSGDALDPRGDGPDNHDVVGTLLRRNKRPDYFSSAQPEPQKGPEVPIPWAGDGQAPIYGVTDQPVNFYSNTQDASYQLRIHSGGDNVLTTLLGTGATDYVGIPPEGTVSSGMYADVAAISASLNALRESAVLQQIYELDARGGTRYNESLLNRWNVDAGDARLQRPEFIGSGSSTFNVSQVAQTSPTVGEDAQASLAAYAEMSAVGHINYTCVEHGHLLVLVNVRAPLTYQQNLNRQWTASSRFDLPEPLTMNLGERAVMLSEIFYPPPLGVDVVWGYQEIWAEYRYMPSFVTGQFRSIVSDSLDPWHLALDYETAPVHNDVWVQDAPPVDRVVQTSTQPQFKFDVLAKGQVARAMPVVSIPGLLRF